MRVSGLRISKFAFGCGPEAVIRGAREQGVDLRLSCLVGVRQSMRPMSVLIRGGEKTRFAVGEKIRLYFPEDKVKILRG